MVAKATPDAPVDDQSGSYDPNDQAATAAYWQQTTVAHNRGRPAVALKRPTLNMRADADVLDAFKATGPVWQTRINAVLRDAVAHRVVKS